MNPLTASLDDLIKADRASKKVAPKKVAAARENPKQAMVNTVNAKKGAANAARVQNDQKAKRDAKVQQRRAAGGAEASSQAPPPKQQQAQSQPKPQQKQKQQQKAPAAVQQQKLKPTAAGTGKLLGTAAKRAQLKLKGAAASLSAAARQPKTLRRAHLTVSGGAAGGKKAVRARPLSIQSSALTQRSQLRALAGAAMPPIKQLARQGPNARGGAAVPPAAAAMMLMNASGLGGMGGMAGMAGMAAGIGAGAPHMFAQQLQLQQLVMQQQQQLAVLQQQQQQFAQSKQAAAPAPKVHASAPKTARQPPKLAITISNSDALTAPVHHAPAPAPAYSPAPAPRLCRARSFLRLVFALASAGRCGADAASGRRLLVGSHHAV